MYGDEMATEGSYDGPEASPARRGDGLDRRLATLEKGGMRLSELLDRLDERLAPILGPDRPRPVSGEVGMARGQDVDLRSTLATFLDSTADHQRRLASRLEYLLERIDL